METTSWKDGCIWPFFGQDPLLSTLAPRLWEWCEQLLVIPPKCSDIDRRKTSSLSSSPVASLEWDWKDQLQFLNLVSFSKTCPYSFLNVNICIIYMYIYIYVVFIPVCQNLFCQQCHDRDQSAPLHASIACTWPTWPYITAMADMIPIPAPTSTATLTGCMHSWWQKSCTSY